MAIKGRRSKREDLVFAVEDPYKNIVRLERYTWDEHITRRHPEVAGTAESVLRALISSPDKIRMSTLDQDVAAFEDGTLRALVLYEDLEFTKGETFGRVTTVYPYTGVPSSVGKVIFQSKSGTNT
jgi:hypothetical protein